MVLWYTSSGCPMIEGGSDVCRSVQINLADRKQRSIGTKTGGVTAESIRRDGRRLVVWTLDSGLESSEWMIFRLGGRANAHVYACMTKGQIQALRNKDPGQLGFMGRCSPPKSHSIIPGLNYTAKPAKC